MPNIIEKDGQWCLDGYGADDACYASEAEAMAAQEKLMHKAAAADPQTEATVEDGTQAPPAGDPATSEEATVDVPASIRKLVLNIGAAAVKALRGRTADEETTGFKVKGNHWLAVWSNNFKDRDGELFSAKAIDAYVSRVDMGVVPLPDLWVWHAGKNVAIGRADWVGTQDHFLMAAGQFHEAGAAQTAKAYYARHAADTGISHGFTFPEKQFDGKTYHSFNTFEISLLPRGAEANWYTSLEGVKAMALSDEKQKYLKDVFGADHAARILADWEARGKALEALGVEFKDFVSTEVTEDASKQAAANADKSFTALVPDLMEGSAEAVTAALEAVKAAKVAQKEAAEALKQVADLRAEMDLRPRSASRASETEVKNAELLETMKKQFVERDPFWNTEVTK